jgi:hypothetical protein
MLLTTSHQQQAPKEKKEKVVKEAKGKAKKDPNAPKVVILL